jgi:hypothetical protein
MYLAKQAYDSSGLNGHPSPKHRSRRSEPERRLGDRLNGPEAAHGRCRACRGAGRALQPPCMHPDRVAAEVAVSRSFSHMRVPSVTRCCLSRALRVAQPPGLCNSGPYRCGSCRHFRILSRDVCHLVSKRLQSHIRAQEAPSRPAKRRKPSE